MSGVAGIYSFSEAFRKDLVKTLYSGLVSLTDRGEAGTGITAVNSNGEIKPYRGLGRVDVAIPWDVIRLFGASICGIAHTRYAREQYPKIENTQPIRINTSDDSKYECYVVADSTFIPSFLDKSTQKLEERGYKFGSLTGAERIGATFITELEKTNDIDEACSYTIEELDGGGGYSSILLVKEKNKSLEEIYLVALRDPHGLKPFHWGEMDETYYLESETHWLEKEGIEKIEEVPRGGGLIVSKNGARTFQVKEKEPKLCNFDPIYFGSPYTRILFKLGPKFYELFKVAVKKLDVDPKFENQPSYSVIRNCLGLALADYYPEVGERIDLFVAAPTTGIGVTEGLSAGYNKPFKSNAVRKVSATGRTFQSSDPEWRSVEVDLKFEVNRELLENKRVGVGEDSIVRGGVTGHKSKKGGLIGQLKNVGRVKEIHMFTSDAPYIFNCFRYWGVEESLVAEGLYGRILKEINKIVGEKLGVNVYYQPLQNICEIFGPNFCRGCKDGRYPIDYKFIPDKIKRYLEKAGVL